MKSCHRCQAPWEEPGQPGFNNTCSRCGMPLHACANCVQFVPRGQIRCLLPEVPMVQDPTAGNRCARFEFARAGTLSAARGPAVAPAGFGGGNGARIHDPAAARRQFEQLFGG
jgi:hypothetical protein